MIRYSFKYLCCSIAARDSCGSLTWDAVRSVKILLSYNKYKSANRRAITEEHVNISQSGSPATSETVYQLWPQYPSFYLFHLSLSVQRRLA